MATFERGDGVVKVLNGGKMEVEKYFSIELRSMITSRLGVVCGSAEGAKWLVKVVT